MLCEECNKKPATVHFTKIINNEKTERHLCEDCAAQEQHMNFNVSPDFSLQQFFSNLLNYDKPVSKPSIVYGENHCKNCGLSYEQFIHGGKMGCSDCYNTFGAQIDSLLKRIHGTTTHVGKLPKRMGGKYHLQREITNLRQQLSQLIKNEEFEKAAQVRDEIKNLENKLDE